MKVLVTYASKHGATRGIAERIADTLEGQDIDVYLRPVEDAGDVADFDAFVIGSAAYIMHWLKDATHFVQHNEKLLASRPTWLFSSGPLGTDEVDAEGRDVREGAEPKEFADFRETIHPRDTRIFFGAYDPDAAPIGVVEHVQHMVPAARKAMPAGDFRDWPEIDEWAAGIARDLAATKAQG